MKVKLIYSNECPHCIKLKEQLEKQKGLPDKEIEFIDALSKEGIEIAEKQNIDQIPTIINDKGICEITYINDKIDVICPNEQAT